MKITLFNADLTTPIEDIELTSIVQNLRFSTKIPGGFNKCSFSLRADLPEAYEWVKGKYNYRLVITDLGKVLFEGRVEEPEFGTGHVGAVCYGYYANLADIPYQTAFNAFASVTIKAALTAVCPQINADQSKIAATDTVIDDDNQKLLDLYPQQLFDKLLAGSDSTFGVWDFAIWEDRIPYLTKRDVTTPKWIVDLADFTNYRFRYRLVTMWNKAYTVYTVAGVINRTAQADKPASQAKYGITREYVVPNIGEQLAATAQNYRDGAIEHSDEIWPTALNTVLGSRVYDANGVEHPSSHVRAGDVIRIRDLIPTTSNLSDIDQDRFQTFYILETSYDDQLRRNTLILDNQDIKLTKKLGKR